MLRTTLLIKDAANHLWVCNDFMQNFITYVTDQFALFDSGFTGYVNALF